LSVFFFVCASLCGRVVCMYLYDVQHFLGECVRAYKMYTGGFIIFALRVGRWGGGLPCGGGGGGGEGNGLGGGSIQYVFELSGGVEVEMASTRRRRKSCCQHKQTQF